ncbi:MAG: amidohydrolase family protein [Devosia sp.]|uniref:metal-dependent hydrolase family protein n=1 Tax=unclassified Devosia TaxID=196773 RepID=UPI0019EC5ADB|nr:MULTISPECIES: amidohydrolase family protein [unclassified Devosia]MBF0678628.1 amidohydrolase family protein [Devosia sp.]WEJ31801.1 amidohydrolase family protein [Devosia sp. SD17-2]
MAEPPFWHYTKIIKPMFDNKPVDQIVLGRIITAVGDEVIEDGFIEVRGGKITRVGARSDLGTPEAGLAVRDTGGKTLLPGLIQSHGHLSWDGIHELSFQSMYDSPEIRAYKAAGNMLKSLRAGITLVRDLGVHNANLFTKQAVAQGIVPGPRLLVSGESIIQTGGHTYWVCREASGADEMRRAVRDQVKGGADLIKIMACHDTLEFTDAELEALIDEAHRNKLPVTAHATYDACIRRVAEFGVDCVEHGGSMSDETIQILLDKKIPIVTTFSALVLQAKPEIARAYGIPEWKIEERQRAVGDKTRFDGLIRAAKAGVPIVFGTDAGSPAVEHDKLAPELEFMVEVGVCPNRLDAIRAATIRAAQLSKLDAKIGSLEVGKEADFIIVDGKPDEDLYALEHVNETYIAGKRMH